MRHLSLFGLALRQDLSEIREVVGREIVFIDAGQIGDRIQLAGMDIAVGDRE